MALELFQQKKRRSFFDNLSEDSAPTDLQPSPSGYPSLVRAPRMRQPEPRAPAPRLRGLAETWINGGDVGVRTDPLKPIRAYGEKLVQARSVPVPYAEQHRREHERPEREDKEYLAPAPGIKRRIAGIAAAFLGGLRDPHYGMEVGQQIIGGGQRRLDRGYKRDVEEYERGLEEARQRDIDERSQARERRAREVHGRYESPEEVQARRAQEAEAQGLTGEAAQSYILTGRIAQPRDGRPERYTRTLPGGKSELLERQPGEQYYRRAEVLDPGVGELAQEVPLDVEVEPGVGIGAGRTPVIPAPRPPAKAVVSYPRPMRPSARDVTSEINSMVEGTATDALEKANGDPNRAIAIVNASENIPPEHKQKVRNRIREKVRPGARTQQGGLEEEINKALRGLEQ